MPKVRDVLRNDENARVLERICSPDGIRTRDLFLESDEVERSSRPTNSLAILHIARLQRTSEKRPIVLRKSTERGGQQAAPFNFRPKSSRQEVGDIASGSLGEVQPPSGQSRVDSATGVVLGGVSSGSDLVDHVALVRVEGRK